jgi:mRNA interferase RelE/StbE
MAWQIELSHLAEKNLDQLDRQAARRILAFLFERIAPLESPRMLGEALTGSRLGNLWRYRVGDYRIICDLEDQILRVVVVRIGHRREVYR